MTPAKRKAEYDRLYDLDSDELAREIAEVIEEVEDRTSALASSHTAIESELQLLQRYEPILQKIQPLAKTIVTTGAYESVALLVERRYKGALQQLKEELDKITKKQCEIVSTDVDEDHTAAIVVFSKTYSEPVHKFLAMENVNQIRLPNEFEGMPFDVAYDELKKRRATLPEDLDDVSTELDEMSQPSGSCVSRAFVTCSWTRPSRSARFPSSAGPSTRSSSRAGCPPLTSRTSARDSPRSGAMTSSSSRRRSRKRSSPRRLWR